MAPIDRPREADAKAPHDLRSARLSALMFTLPAHEFVADLEDDQRLGVLPAPSRIRGGGPVRLPSL